MDLERYHAPNVWGTGDIRTRLIQIGSNGYWKHGNFDEFVNEKIAEAGCLQSVLQVTPLEVGVEIGSGTGVHARYFAERSKFLYTIDITDNFLDLFAVATEGISNIRRIRKSFFPMMSEVGPESVDYVYATSVFCHVHVYDIYLYFEEIARVLKPGGRFWVNYQNADNCTFDEFYQTFLENYRKTGIFSPIYPAEMQFHSNEYFRRTAARFGLGIAHERIEGTYSEFMFRKV